MGPAAEAEAVADDAEQVGDQARLAGLQQQPAQRAARAARRREIELQPQPHRSAAGSRHLGGRGKGGEGRGGAGGRRAVWDKKGGRERRTWSCGRVAGGMGALRAAVGLALFAALAAGTGGERVAGRVGSGPRPGQPLESACAAFLVPRWEGRG